MTDKQKIIDEIKTYNGKFITPERMMDLNTLSKELGDEYTVKIWTYGKKLRTAVIKGEVQL